MSLDLTSGPAVVAIAGSCTTRDNFNSRFNPGYKDFFEVRLAANQTSMITMMSPPVEPDFEPIGQMSDYDRWNVRSDMTREFLAELAALRPDYLIVDFFADIHFGVIRLADGRFLTDNRWKLHRTDYYQRLLETGDFDRLRLQRDTEAYFALWTKAVERFAAHVAEHCPDTTVIVHRGLNVDRVLVPDRTQPVRLRRHKPTLSKLDVPLANRLWSRLDDYAIERFGWRPIDLRDGDYTSFTEHPWGPFYVHYTMDYYHRFLAELHRIDLERRLGDSDLARVDQIRDATAELVGRRLGQTERVLADCGDELGRARRRIAELEGLGPIRAVRFALGQRVRARARRRAADDADPDDVPQRFRQ